MSHWFHRNKLKATIDQKFDGKGTLIQQSNYTMSTKFQNLYSPNTHFLRKK